VVFVTYDENDGLFDHVPPPTPPPGTLDEFVGGEPIGLGFRVPMTVISPWSRGGWVNSELFDHTSMIRFIEAWRHPHTPFPTISAWRRAVCGDLAGCFDFTIRPGPHPRLPAAPRRAIVPGTPGDLERGLPAALPSPLSRQVRPIQAAGHRRARALPYQPTARLTASAGLVTVTVDNAGTHAVCLNARTAEAVRWLTVPSEGSVSTSWPLGAGYDIALHGPNRFLWHYRGSDSGTAAALSVDAGYSDVAELTLTLRNAGVTALDVGFAAQRYHRARVRIYRVPAGATRTVAALELRSTSGWYDAVVTVAADPTFHRRFTGRQENSRPGVTG
jgi:phospholipase C